MSLQSTPPKIPLRFLRWFCHPDLLEDVEGDLAELFDSRLEKSRFKAKMLFVLDVLLLFRIGIIKNFKPFNSVINYAMISNFLKIARRNALRYKGNTILNLLGLIIGISSSLLITLLVYDEVSVDKFHTNGNQIYQLFRNMRQSESAVVTTESIPKPAADLMAAEYPEVDEIALVSWRMDRTLGAGDDNVTLEGRFVSPEFLNMFTFPLIIGDKNTALNDLGAIVISKSTALSQFGEDWPSTALGASIRLDNQYEVKVTGVFEDPGSNSSLDFDWLMPADQFINNNQWMNDWGNGSFRVYFTTETPEKAKAVGDRILDEITNHTVGADNAGMEQLIVHKFQDYYLYSNFDNGAVNGGRIDYIRILTVVAIFILVIACINFMNLTTARSERRTKEVGIRKVMGAQRFSLSIQFFLEAIVFSTFATLVAVVVAHLLLPFFNHLIEKNLFIPFGEPITWIFLIGTAVIVGLLSGSYPALLLSAMNIIQSLKGKVKKSVSALFMRRGLVIFQFGISTFLIIGTLVISQQLRYMLNKDIGLDKENLLALRIATEETEKLDAYKTELLKSTHIKSVSRNSGNPISYGRSTSSANWEGKDPNTGYEVNVMITDVDFIETMGMEMLKGRGFDNQFNDSTNFIINQVAADIMGFDDPIGKDLSFWGINGEIIGVVKNFHMLDMHEAIAPLIITCIDPSQSFVVMVRTEEDIVQAIEAIDDVTKATFPETNYEYEFVDTILEDSYQVEIMVNTLVNILAGISIFISCLGLFGLSSYTAEQRSKEVGIRKVQGARVSQIVFLLSREYAKLIVIACIIAIPFAYYVMQDYLSNFVYRTLLKPDVFIYAGLISIVVGACAISIKLYNAAVSNPVKSLRQE
ncbi:MAG: ABC transporter permease [Bacteroidota bacterium]